MNDMIVVVEVPHFENDCVCSHNLLQISSKVYLSRYCLKFRGHAVTSINSQFIIIFLSKGYFSFVRSLARHILDVFAKPTILGKARLYLANISPNKVETTACNLSAAFKPITKTELVFLKG